MTEKQLYKLVPCSITTVWSGIKREDVKFGTIRAQSWIQTSNQQLKSFDHSRLPTARETKGHILLRRTTRVVLSAQWRGHGVHDRGTGVRLLGRQRCFCSTSPLPIRSLLDNVCRCLVNYFPSVARSRMREAITLPTQTSPQYGA